MSDGSELDTEFQPKKSNRVVALVVFAFAIAASAFGAWYAFIKPPSLATDLLFVAVSTETADGNEGMWWAQNGRASARFVDALSKALDKSGLEIISAGDPKTLELLEGLGTDEASVIAAAQRLGCGYALTGSVRVVRTAEVPESDQLDLTAEVDFSLRVIGEDGGSASLNEPKMRFHWRASTEDESLLELAGEIPKWYAARLAAALSDTPEYKAFEKPTEEMNNRELAMASKLESILLLARQRRDAMGVREAERERAVKEDDAREVGERAKTRISDIFAAEYMVGLGPDGRLLALVDPHYVEITRERGGYAVLDGHEQLIWIDPDSGERELAYETYNYFSSPGISADGSTIAAVLDHWGYSKSLSVIDAKSGEARHLVVHPEHYWSSPVPSPKGKWVVVWRRDCRRCSSELTLYPTGDGEPTVLIGPDEGSQTVASWLPDESAIVLGIRADERDQVLRIDIPSGDRTVLFPSKAENSAVGDSAADGAGDDGDGADDELAGDEMVDEVELDEPAVSRFTQPQLSPDGTRVAVVELGDDGRWLGLAKADGTEYRRVFEGRAQWPEWAPDSSAVAFETWRTEDGDDPRKRDTEVVIVRLDGTVTQLTKNAYDDDAVGWSKDASKVYFHRNDEDPDNRRAMNRIYSVSAK